MLRVILSVLALILGAAPAWSQGGQDTVGDNAIIIGGVNPSLQAGSEAIRIGDYAEGIELTLRGLEDRTVSTRNRSAALSNLCAAYAARQLPDTAIRYCTEALALDAGNWHAFSNRSYAYWLKGQFAEAAFDLDAARAINPRAWQVAEIRGMLNEARLTPHIVMEDLQ